MNKEEQKVRKWKIICAILSILVVFVSIYSIFGIERWYVAYYKGYDDCEKEFQPDVIEMDELLGEMRQNIREVSSIKEKLEIFEEMLNKTKAIGLEPAMEGETEIIRDFGNGVWRLSLYYYDKDNTSLEDVERRHIVYALEDLENMATVSMSLYRRWNLYFVENSENIGAVIIDENIKSEEELYQQLFYLILCNKDIEGRIDIEGYRVWAKDSKPRVKLDIIEYEIRIEVTLKEGYKAEILQNLIKTIVEKGEHGSYVVYFDEDEIEISGRAYKSYTYPLEYHFENMDLIW